MKRTNNVNIMAFFNILAPVILNGINFFTIPIFTRILGTDNYGLYTIYITWVNVFTILISLQVQGTLGVANVRMKEEDKPKYVSSILTIIWLSFFVLFAVVCIFLKPFSDLFSLTEEIVILMMLHALGMAFINFASNKFTYDKKAQNNFLISVGVAVIGIALSLGFLQIIKNEDQLYIGRALGAAIPYIVIGLGLSFYFLWRGKTGFSRQYWKFCLPLCIPLVFHGLSQNILSQADKVMLQKMTNDSIVGIFGFTVSFAQIMNIIYNAFNTTWVPFYYDDMKNKDYAAIEKRTRNYIIVFTGLSLGFILLAPEVIKLFAEEEFWSGIPLIPVLVLGYYMMFLYSFPVNFEFYHKKTIHIAVGTASAAIVNCILNYFMIKARGMQGAAEATFLSYLLLWIFHHLVAKYIIKGDYHYKIKTFIPAIAVMLVGCIIVNFTLDLIILRWGIAVVIGLGMLYHLYKVKTIF